MGKIRNSRESALTIIEVLLVIAIIAILLAMFLPALAYSGPDTGGRCAGNLKQIGGATQSWLIDHHDNYPMEVSTNDGGTKEFKFGSETFEHFIVLSNYLKRGSPVLVCPIDRRDGYPYPPKDFLSLSNLDVSYFINLNATHSRNNFFLCGDFFLTSSVPQVDGILTVSKETTVGWKTKHFRSASRFSGNILFPDGHVDSLPDRKLQKALNKSDIATNNLSMPD